MIAANKELIVEGASRMGLTLDGEIIDRLGTYIDGLMKWNSAYNLTAIRDEKEMVIKHLLDSMSLLPFCDADDLLDVGTGAGLPGMVLAICKPSLAVTLLDSNGKKVRFLRHMVAELHLQNVQTVQARVEEFQGQTFARISSRAFASLADMVQGCRPLLARNGRFLAMKGRYPQEEMAALPEECKVVAVERLAIPFLNDERHVLLIEQCSSSITADVGAGKK